MFIHMVIRVSSCHNISIRPATRCSASVDLAGFWVGLSIRKVLQIAALVMS